nr:gamma-glutamyltransferase [Falsirhodobacter halotolerans]
MSLSQRTRKVVEWTERGVVASQHRRASEAGAEVLRAGGNAFDAAIATSFAIGVVEPWMSGPMGGGMMVLWPAEGTPETIEFGMRSPKDLDPADYPLIPGATNPDLFPWTRVEGDRNAYGGSAVAVPGTVAGMAMAHQRHGTLPWADLLAPGIALAREGLEVDWYAALIIASATRQLAQDTDAAAMFLIDGQWPNIGGWTSARDVHLDQSAMAATLTRLAEAGAGDFYSGDIAHALADDVQAKGGRLSVADLAAYRARVAPTRQFAHNGGVVHAASGLSAGAELGAALAAVKGGVGPDSLAALAAALGDAYRARLESSGDVAPTCTTSFSVVDAAGNMVTVTQTLLSIFGAHVVSPNTGMLLNNGIMWFDPEQGRPNSLGPDKACLMNVCPMVGEVGDRRFALGAAGGRKILPSVACLTHYIMDGGMSLEEAFHHPRLDNTGAGMITADDSFAPDVLNALAQVGAVKTARRGVFPYAFAVPAGVMRQGGRNCGCTEIMTPWGDVAFG